MTETLSTPAVTARPPVRVGGPEWRELLARIAKGASRREQDLEPPHEAIGWLKEAGVGALRVPVEHGGAGIGVRELFAALIDLAEADSNVAHILRVHFGFVEQVRQNPDPAYRERWFRRIVEDDAVIGNGISEKDGRTVGTNEFSTILAPAAEGDGYVLNGEKFYSTGSRYADWTQIFASTPQGHTAMIVIPVDRPGVSLLDDWDGFGQRLTATGTTLLDDVAVAADEVVDLGPPSPTPPPTYRGAFFQLFLQAVTAGILRSVTDDAARLVRRRQRSFSHSAADRPTDDPQVLQVVGEIAADAFAAEAIVLAAADRIQDAADSVHDGVPDAERCAEAQRATVAAKVAIDRFAAATATRLFDAGGASATQAGPNLDRHWRNIRTLSTHNPTMAKATALGAYVVNDTPFPRNGYF